MKYKIMVLKLLVLIANSLIYKISQDNSVISDAETMIKEIEKWGEKDGM